MTGPWDKTDPPNAHFLDGHSATLHPAWLSLDESEGDGVLVIRTAQVSAPPPIPDPQQRPGARLVSDPARPDAPRRWAMPDLRAVPGQAGRDTVIVTHKDHPLARLIVHGPQARQVILRRARHLSVRPPVRGRGRLAIWAAAALSSVALILFVLLPSISDQLAKYLPYDGEKALGDTTYGQIREALSRTNAPVQTCVAPDGLEALGRMRERLEAQANLPYPLTVSVLDHDMINAFALPGGRIVLFRGLIEAAQSPEEVAAVFAHEMGHVESRDPTRHALRSAGSFGVLGLLFGDFAGGTVVLALANRLINAQYTQAAEADADTYGYRILQGADVSPVHFATFFGRMRNTYGETDGIMRHLESHPNPSARIDAARTAADALDAPTRPILTNAQWAALRGVCDVTGMGDIDNGSGAD